MGIAIPQVIAEDRASGAQVIDGSLNFDRSSGNYLKKTISTTGNKRTFTISGWFKKCRHNGGQYLFTTEYLGADYFELTMLGGEQLQIYNNKATAVNLKPTRLFRDNAWFHVTIAVDTTIVSPTEDRVKFYINGERHTDFDATGGGNVFPAQNYVFELVGSRDWYIGTAEFSGSISGSYYDGHMSNFYFVDGQALGPEYFGFTDPLTNTWRPKKFEGPTSPNDGTTWSSNLTVSGGTYTIVNPGYAFDNDSYDTYADASGSGDAVYTFTPPSTIRANSSVRVFAYAASGQDTNHIKITYNNGVEVTKTAADLGLGTPGDHVWFDLSSYINFPADISSIEYKSIGGGGRISAIEIDGILLIDGFNDPKGFGTNGFYLPMDGNSLIGEDKSGNSNINDGTIWSKDVTTSNAYSANRDPGKGFDGNSSLVGQSDTYVQSDNSSGTVTWTPNGYTIDTADEILVKGISSLDRLSVVGSLGSQSNIAPATVNGITNVYTIPTNLGTLTSLTVTGNSSLAGWSGISVGGILLVNGLKGNSWTPVNFGGSNTIEKATGALPILNTVSGGRVATVGVRTDAFANNLVLALPLVDTTTDVSGIINSGTTSKTITAYGNAAPASDGEGNFYDVSLYLDGTSDYVETSNSDDFVVGTGDFTIEAWYNVAATQGTNPRLFAQNVNNDNNWDCYIDGNPATGTGAIKMHGGSVDLVMSFPSANAWHHFCIARKNGILYSFMNGVLRHTQTYTNSVGVNNHGFRVGVIGGSGGSTGYGLQGYVQDFRFYKGVAKYTSDFIPASTNPDILPDTPSGVSGSSKLAKITDGAVYFDGNGDRLSIENNTDLTFGGGDFTMEAFVYIDSSSTGFNSLVSKYDGGSQSGAAAGRSWMWCLQNGIHQFYYYYNSGNSAINATSSTRVNYSKWTHCAVAREGNTIRLFDDGQLVDTIDLTSIPAMNDGGTIPIAIGGDSVGTSTFDMDGYISNVRIVKGTALYTSNFTPPTEPLTNITNTKLLCAQSTSESKDITGKLYKTSFAYDNASDVIANGTLLEGGETLLTNNEANGEYLYYIPNGNELTGQQIFSADGAITNGDSSNSWSWMRHDGTNWLSITGGYTPGQFDEFYFGADNTSYKLDPSRDFYALTLLGGTSPSAHGGTAPTLKKQFVLDGAVIPSNTRQLIDQLYATVSNFNPFNADIDIVRGQETSYATLNPLATQKSGTLTLSNGNLTATIGATRTSAYASLPFVGKMYYEVTFVYDRAYVFGMAPSSDFNTTADTVGQRFIGESSGSYGASDDGNAWNNLVNTSIESFAVGDCMGWAYDSDSGKYSIFKNGINIGTFTADTSRTYYPAITMISSGAIAELNFGQKPFKFPPPDGYGPVNAANVRPVNVIARPDQYVGVTTYTGNDEPNHEIVVGLKPDLVWIKSRDAARNHRLTDTVRGAGKELYSDLPNSEGTVTDGVTLFTDKGFVLGANNNYNYTEDYVAWWWKAGDENVQYAADTFTDEVINKSESWHTTSDLTNPHNAFDNDIWNGATYLASSTRNITTNSFTATKIRIRSNGGNSGQIFTVNGTGYTFNTGNNVGTWNEIDLGTPTTVTSLQVSGTGNFTVYAIEVDGRVLVDSTHSLVYPGLASTVRANSKAGFSIIQYNGGSGERSVSHGLSSAPKFVMAKKTNAPNADWAIYHNSLRAPTDTLDQRGRYYLKFNSDPQNVDDTYWDGKKPTDRVINLGTNTSTNTSGGEYIMYAWHDVPGLQKFGSYLGNADNDGTFVELGFRPVLLWIKRSTDGANGWYVVDTEKSPINLANDYLYLNSNSGDSGFTNGAVDILSNGFKMRANTQATNNAATYIYCAWAEAPAVNLYGATSNAR